MDRFERFTLSVFSITRYWNKIATEEMKGYGLKGAYALYLVMLDKAEEGLTAAQLSEVTQRDKADVSRAIAQFRKQDLVKPYGDNRYRAPITLTEKGRKLCKQIEKKAGEALQYAGQGISEEMRQNMYQALEIIAKNLKDFSEN